MICLLLLSVVLEFLDILWASWNDSRYLLYAYLYIGKNAEKKKTNLHALSTAYSQHSSGTDCPTKFQSVIKNKRVNFWDFVLGNV